MTTNIYVLQLKNDKYYIGKSSNIDKRYKQHLEGNGSTWTKIHKPIKIVEIFEKCDIYDEDKYVKKYMAEYGIDNVRGGSYVTRELDYYTKISLQKEIWQANDLCTRCGRNTHFVSHCYAKRDVNNNLISSDEEEYFSDEEEYFSDDYDY